MLQWHGIFFITEWHNTTSTGHILSSVKQILRITHRNTE